MEKEDFIREQMEDTRTSLTEKLETLEKQVAGTVLGATSNVAEKVEAVTDTVQETVASVRDTVQETFSTVKETVHKSVSAVRDVFDIAGHVARHPWPMLAGSVVLGYAAGAAFGSRRPSRAQPPRSVTEPESLLAKANGRHPATENARSPGLLAKFAPELSKLKSIALSALVGAVREKVVTAAPKEIAPSLAEFFDNISLKITGEPARSGLHESAVRHEDPSLGSSSHEGPASCSVFSS
jgi:hypothetical protein